MYEFRTMRWDFVSLYTLVWLLLIGSCGSKESQGNKVVNFSILSDDRVSPEFVKQALNEVWKKDPTDKTDNNFRSLLQTNGGFQSVNPSDPTDVLKKVCRILPTSPLFILFVTRCNDDPGLMFLTGALRIPFIQIGIIPEKQCRQSNQRWKEDNLKYFIDTKRTRNNADTPSSSVRRSTSSIEKRDNLSPVPITDVTRGMSPQRNLDPESEIFWEMEEQRLVGQYLSSLQWGRLIALYDFSLDFGSLQNVLEYLGERMQYVTVQKLPIDPRTGNFVIKSSKLLMHQLFKKALLQMIQCNNEASQTNSKAIIFVLFCSEQTTKNIIIELLPYFSHKKGVHFYIVDIGWTSNFMKGVLFSREFTIITKFEKQMIRSLPTDKENLENLKKQLTITLQAAAKVVIQMNASSTMFESNLSCDVGPKYPEYQSLSIVSALRDELQAMKSPIANETSSKPENSRPDDKQMKEETFLNEDVVRYRGAKTDLEARSRSELELKSCGISSTGLVECKCLVNVIAENNEASRLLKFPYMRHTNHTGFYNRILNTRKHAERYHPYKILANRTFRVATIQDPPFVLISYANGKTTFTGFSIDLLDALSHLGGFDYELYEVADKKYGSLKNGTWNGLVGDLIKKKADLAISAITVTPQREKVVDFTKRYMDYAVGILMLRPSTASTMLAFLNPFHSTVWYSILGGWFVVSILLYILNRVSPKNPGITEIHDKSLHGTFWFVYSTLVQQGTGMCLSSISAQIVTGVWWFFVLIIVSSYTANLAAHLTLSRMETDIRSFPELSIQTNIQYGTVRDTSIYDYLQTKGEQSDMQSAMWLRLWKMVNGTNSVSVAEEGIQRVRQSHGRYAFLWDVAVIQYMVLNDPLCSLTTVHDFIFDKGYGIAVQQGDAIKDVLSLGILELEDQGVLSKLKARWWKSTGCELNGDKKAAHSSHLTLKNFSGVFCILGGGLVFASMVALCELCTYSRRQKRERKKLVEKKLKSKMATSNSENHPVVSFEQRNNDEIHIIVSGIDGMKSKSGIIGNGVKNNFKSCLPARNGPDKKYISTAKTGLVVNPEELVHLTSENQTNNIVKRKGHFFGVRRNDTFKRKIDGKRKISN